MSQGFEPIACSLPLRDAAEQAGEWNDLFGHAVGFHEVPGGIHVRYPLELAEQVENLVAREQACCAWLTLESSRSDGEVHVTLTSANPESGPVIQALVGIGT